MGDDGWDTSDFLKRYASKSQDAPSNHVVKDDEMNGLMESESTSQVNMYDPCNDYLFCTTENLAERLQYLNQELSILGFPPILDKAQLLYEKDVDVHFDVTKLVNCTYDLLKRHHRQLRMKDDIEARQIRSDNDNDMLLQTQDRLRTDIENLKREGALSLFREKEQLKKCTCLQRDVKNEREEKRKMKNDVDYLRKQFYHESKRLEKEISRLKEKVHQTLSDKSSERKMTIDILNPVLRSDGKRSRWKAVANKNEEEMYRLVIANYEEKEKVILMENHAMRESLSEVHNNLTKVDSSITSEALAENTKEYQMPFHMVKEDIDNKLKYAIMSLKSKVDKAIEKEKELCVEVNSEPIEEAAPVVNKPNEEMLNKLEQCKVVIASQEKLIQGMKDGYSEEAFEKLLTTFGTREDEIIEYEQRMKLFQEQQQHFDEERKKFTEYVLKMAKEKEEFERERVEFYMHCISTPVINKDMKNIQKGTLKSCPSAPNFASAQRIRNGTKKQRTPSTGDLYKYLSLTYDSASRNKSGGSPNSDGSFLYHEENSPVKRSSSRKVREHTDKIRKAVEDRQNRSGEEKIRNILSELENLN